MSEKKTGATGASAASCAVESGAENARRWIASPEGQQAMAESLERARKITAQFRDAQRVDPEDLHKPVTL